MRNVPDRAAIRWICRVTVLLGAAVGLYRYTWLPYRANHVLFDVEQRGNAAEMADPLKGMPLARTNLKMLDSVATACWTDANYHMLYAANARILRRPDIARQHYDDALAVDCRPEIYVQRGFLSLENGHLDAAMPDFIRAVRFNPGMLDQLGGELGERVAHAAGLD